MVVHNEIRHEVGQTIAATVEDAVQPLAERLEQLTPEHRSVGPVNPASTVPQCLWNRILKCEFICFDDLLTEVLGSPAGIRISVDGNQPVELIKYGLPNH